MLQKRAEGAFVALFTRKPMLSSHVYQRVIYEIVYGYGRPHADRARVRGFNEEGHPTTPLKMVVRKGNNR